MSRSLFLLFAMSLAAAPLPVIAATPGALQAEQSTTMPGPAEKKGGKLAGLLTPQQQAMFALENRAQIKAMAPADRKAWRKGQVAKLLAMSPDDRQKFQAGLDARWNALPPKQKARIQQRLAAR